MLKKITKKILANEKSICFLFLAPSLIGFSIFYLFPFFISFYYSFVESVFSYKFVGLNNYISVLNSKSFLKAAKNTLIFTSFSVPLNILLSLFLATLVNQKIYCRKLLRSFLVSPLVVPVASTVFFWRIMFHQYGVVNYFLITKNGTPVDWLNTESAILVILIIYLWKNIGYSMVLFIAGLQNIPQEFYESSYIDGANWWVRFTRITLIYLTPTTFFVFIMCIINSFKVFREIYLMAGDYPHESIYMLQHYMNNTFAALDYQKLTSAAFILGSVIFLLVFCLFKVERKISKNIS